MAYGFIEIERPQSDIIDTPTSLAVHDGPDQFPLQPSADHAHTVVWELWGRPAKSMGNAEIWPPNHPWTP